MITSASPVKLPNETGLFFPDLSALVVDGFHPAEGAGRGWIRFDYELDCFAGVGLATGAESGAGELVLDLGLIGWHRLHLAHNPRLRVWLDGDPGYCEVTGDRGSISEYAFPAADFTGRKLHIAPGRNPERQEEVTIFYLRAEPCEPRTNHRNLIATNDGHNPFCKNPQTPQDFLKAVYELADSDFFRLVWGTYGGSMLTLRPDTKAGFSPIWPDGTSFRTVDLHFNRSLQRMRDAGVDPLALVRQATRDIGIELDYYYRTACFYGPFPLSGKTTDFYREHPEWRSVDEFGRTLTFISYAFPQVQEAVLAYFAELLDYEPDGLCIAFNRGLPMMICEEPVRAEFRRRHGRDPKLPEEVDSPEMLAVRHAMLADFVERVKRLCESRGARLSCIAPRDFERNFLTGLNLDLLLERGLLDNVMIGAGHKDDPALNLDLAPLMELRNKYGIPIYPGGSNSKGHGCAWTNDGGWSERARYMRSILEAGFEGAFIWDVHNIAGHDWDTLRQFGDRVYLDRLADGEAPPPISRKTLSIGGAIGGRYSTWIGY
jgi:hypothetical protein